MEDCTKHYDLARTQLSAPEFLNVRIFDRLTWIGYIYLLDYTEPPNVVIFDRIRIARERPFVPLDLFGRILGEMHRAITEIGPYRLLSPLRIRSFHPYSGNTRSMHQVSCMYLLRPASGYTKPLKAAA